MPRKQRFKPSRKPQSNQGTVSSQQVDDRKENNPETHDIERSQSSVIEPLEKEREVE